LCRFIVPAVVRQGLVTFAVSTAGASPALAKFLARRLGTAFGPEVGALAEVLARLRPELKKAPMEDRKRIMEDALARAADGGFSPDALAAMTENISKALKEGQRGESDGKS
jgi:siroheme synthase-like protein